MADMYQTITNRIIEQLEKVGKGINPFAEMARMDKYNYKTKRGYSLLNSLFLPKKGGYLTFKQALDMGGKPKKGSKTYPIYFYTLFKKVKEDGNEEEIPVLRYFNVFHIDDIEGITFNDAVPTDQQPIEEIEDVISDYLERSGVQINYIEEQQAYYNKDKDAVTIAMPDKFTDATSYYHVLMHELSHSTGTLERLHRKEIVNGTVFGSGDYSREELTAELSACMLMAHFGCNAAQNIKMTAEYVKSWIQALNNDKRMIVYASSRAEKACKYILTGEEPQY
jgi:antirestriction protein ArdC